MNGQSLKLFWRRTAQRKSHFFINLFGLSVAIAATTLIFLWVNHEISFDRHFSNADNIYRVYPEISVNGKDFSNAMAPPPLMRVLTRDFPEVMASTRIWSYPNKLVSYEQEGHETKAFNEKRLYQADSTFFDLFNIRMLQGDARKALTVPFKMVITEETAIRYFGEAVYRSGKALGKSLSITFFGKKYDCEVTGITENVPANSHFHYDLILSNVTDPWCNSNVWVDNTYYTYVLLRPGSNPKALEAKLPSLIRTHLNPQLQVNFGVSYDALRKRGEYWDYKLLPLTDIHLGSNFARELEPNGNRNNVTLLMAVAFFMLLIACINYTNLTMAGAIERSREVGVRKVLGSTVGQLRAQFFTESALMSGLALVLATLLIMLLLNPFTEILGASLPTNPLREGTTWLLLGGIFSLVTLLGGAYPAYYLSTFTTTLALKGKVSPRSGTVSFQGVLVTAQFAISITLAICSLVVYRQLNLLRSQSAGFQKDNVIMVADPSVKLRDQSEVFIQELSRFPGINSASVCSDYPGSGSYSFPIAARRKGESADQLLYNFTAGYDFLKTFSINLLEGRDFAKTFDDASPKRVILNETAVRMLGLKTPIHAQIVTKNLNVLKLEEQTYEVIGVVKDFNFESLHKAILPMAIFLDQNGSYISIRVKPGNPDQHLAAIRQVWEKRLPGIPFEYSFLDSQLDTLYKTERSLSQVLAILTGLTILVAAVGLFGLTLLMVQRRTKEIGIRKVIGASLADVLLTLNRDYIRWMGAAFLIACPMAWFAMNRWLQHFAYQATIPWWLFAATGILALGIALLTASFQTIRAALQNPVNSLRNE
ncbi:putative ABC transport system permease protein [Spirosoma lacussanchae]|uniref:ABC transporter permease n=1 Tax=Spirosoma lacussanchae TaxID=1884249 RepID=UPI0011083C16|nr:ABC transporter permease [Spirosoma lacussanchae]